MIASVLQITETPGEIADLQQQQSDLIYGPKQLTGWLDMLDGHQIDRDVAYVFCGVNIKSLGVVSCCVLACDQPPLLFLGGGLLVDVFWKKCLFDYVLSA